MVHDRHLWPIVATLLGIGCLSLMDAFMKGAALAAGAYSATMLRSAIGAAIIAPVWIVRGGRWPRPDVLKIHLLRGTVSAIMALSFFYALTKLPIAEAIAISFVAPLIALYLAAILLGEVIRRKAVVGSALGFAGTLVIIANRLGNSEYDAETLKGLGAILFSATLYAWNFIIIRKQALVSGPIEATTFHSGIGCMVLLAASPWLFEMPSHDTLGNILAASLLTIVGALTITWAYARAEAQLLVPVEYTGFLWAGLFGWLFYRETITASTVVGAAMIVTGCYFAIRKGSSQPSSQSA